MSTLRRWKGLSALIGDAVEHGSAAVERIHMASARRPFQIIEKIPVLEAPTKLVHGVHDAIVSECFPSLRRPELDEAIYPPSPITVPMSAIFKRPLTKLTSATLENNRLNPAAGEILENLGFRLSADQTSRC